ncbi:MAG: hypothetical protein AB1896_18640 [Thermodesulfobacteriota bacterium]
MRRPAALFSRLALAAVLFLLSPPAEAPAGGLWDEGPGAILRGRPIERLQGLAGRMIDRVVETSLRGLYEQARAASSPVVEELLQRLRPHWAKVTDRPLPLEARVLVSPGLIELLSGFGVFGTRKEGVVFYDVIILGEALPPTTTGLVRLGHELVHVAQFRELGFEKFLFEYAHGWAEAGGQYLKNPFEIEACRVHLALEARLEAGL